MGCCSSKTDNTVEYTLHILTSDAFKGAGSDSSVYIDMIGEQNGIGTGWIKVHNVHKNDFERGKMDKFKIKAKDIGLPLIIRLELRHRSKPDKWACDEITVLYGNTEVMFPVYDWIENEIWFTRGKALTHTQVKSPAVKSMRQREIEATKVKFQWIVRPNIDDIGWGLPRYVDATTFKELPKIFHATDVRQDNLFSRGFEAIVNRALATVKNAFSKIDDLDDYSRLYKHLQEDQDPVFMNRWKTDAEFGRQQLIGISPTSISKCTTLPDCCQISHSHVYDILNNGYSLEQEMQRGRIFIGDYSEVFQGVIRNKNSKGDELYCPDAICLYYASPEEDFIPIAIQLVPNDPETIFTPKDSAEDWLLAKMYFKVALSNLHEWHYHFMLTHNVMEPFAVSLFRCFPRSHPIYKLLRPHLQTVSIINALARDTLIKKGTLANKALALEGEDLARHTFKDFKMDDLVIPKVLKERGLDDKEILPKNYYRDDALSLWQIIEKFVSDIIKHFYEHDQDVLLDEEIQAFAKDMAHEGLGWQDGNTRGLDSKIEDVDTLICLCTSIIYTSSVQHATVNFPQYETYKFVPNSPLAMRLPPHKRGEATMSRILKSLPDVDMATITITIAYTLSSFSPDEVYLGEYPMRLFTDPEVLTFIDHYQKALKLYSDKVKERNEYADEYAYEYLLPDRVPNSIAI
uniref:allene oxide synthase-lipoxygenase protein-like n=1 Tax=Styela clava TaxID=7725 RepID=UPI00193A57B3|nr:allene oxide synthase-lipoxygenase protein-like [Styela clava]